VNQPVLRRADGVVEITSHNHGFAVQATSLGEQVEDHAFRTADHGVVEVSHVNLNDDVCEGLTARDIRAFSVQYHPEAAPGPTTPATSSSASLAPSKEARVPRRDDLTSILVLGSGPIVIGQAAEFDYSGTQACKVLREEGLRVILVNSNPATIMTDPAIADATYVEPLTVDAVRAVIEKERPDALLPTLGGQTALNLAVELYESGVLEELGVEVLGADLEAIQTAEDRQRFKEAMAEIGLDTPRSTYARTEEDAFQAAAEYGYPVVLRPSFTLGGKGGGIAYDADQLKDMIRQGLYDSPVHEVLVEESVLGWKEYELEVMRDRHDNCVIVCSIENLDAMGVHTGDSITVAPAMTLSDPEYQRMRDAAFAVLRRIGVETGGSNVQFAVDPATGRMIVIEMNPRVSRSSALASKATGFPIAKIAAKLALGYTLDEIANDITRETKAAFEPTIDYVVTKIPRFAFEKFRGTDDTLTTKMKSVGEVMAMGRTFKESLNKALRSLEDGTIGFGAAASIDVDEAELEGLLSRPTADRLHAVDEALTRGWSVERVSELTGLRPVVRRPAAAAGGAPPRAARPRAPRRRPRRAAARRQARRVLRRAPRPAARHHRGPRPRPPARVGIRPVFKTVDTCAAEFEAFTPYHYSTYEDEDEVRDSGRDKVIVLGSGPNRIGQGVEFDYCCVHAVFALRDAGYETIMVNCNPETVSTDYDTADRLYFEPLTFEDVLEVCHREQPVGVLVQMGGQTPLKLAQQLEAAGVPIWGTAPDAIDAAEDRGRFGALMRELDVAMPPGGIARSFDEAREIALQIGYPVLVRPSYVLGGRAMQIVYDEAGLKRYLTEAVAAAPDQPILVDRFLEGAIEIDVDAVFDGEETFVGGVLEHIEEAGVHSGDSACTLPPITLGRGQLAEIRRVTDGIARGLGVRGLLNVQFALKDDVLSCIEANPRASRTVPFVSKATGVPLAKVAARVMAGATLAELRARGSSRKHDAVEGPRPGHVAVKEAVLPFDRFPGVDALLGPEMRSTGEVMGIDADFGAAFAKSQAGTGSMVLPGAAPADGRGAGGGVRLGRQPRQARDRVPGQAAARPRLRDRRHRGDRRRARPGRRPGHRRRQGVHRRPQHPRPARVGADQAGAQHPVRAGHPRRRLRHPAGGDHQRGALHHHPVRHPRRHPGRRGAAAGRRAGALAAGVPGRAPPPRRRGRRRRERSDARSRARPRRERRPRPGHLRGAGPPPRGRVLAAVVLLARDRRAGPARPVRQRRGRRAGGAAAPAVLDRAGLAAGGLRRHRRRRLRRARAGHRVADHRRRARPHRRGRPARHAVPAAAAQGRLPAGRRRVRRRAAVLPRRGADPAGAARRHDRRRGDQERILNAIEAKRLTASVTFTTEDGSYGERARHRRARGGRASCRSGVVYACGPNPMLRAVSERCQELELPVQVAVEERMACGIGVCFTCVLPVRTKDGSVR
jgi:carbamoyl-phosphate synthase large subunit